MFLGDYFESMFCRDLSEATLAEIEFPQESSLTLRVLVDFLYTHQLPDSLDTYADIYIAADKYRLLDLMQLIRDRLPRMSIPALVGMVRLACSGSIVTNNVDGDGDLDQQVLRAVKERLSELKASSDSIRELFLDERCHTFLLQLF